GTAPPPPLTPPHPGLGGRIKRSAAHTLCSGDVPDERSAMPPVRGGPVPSTKPAGTHRAPATPRWNSPAPPAPTTSSGPARNNTDNPCQTKARRRDGPSAAVTGLGAVRAG